VSGRSTALVFMVLLAQGGGCAGPEPSGALPEVAAPRASPEPEPVLVEAVAEPPAEVVVDAAPDDAAPVLPASGPPEDFGQIRPPLAGAEA
jgi:hypothetical protein